MKPLQDCRLYTFVDTAYLDGREPSLVAQQLCDGGADLIQLRAKDASKEFVRWMAESVLAITQRAGVWFVLNDYPDIAVEIGAPLCHLGQEDFFETGFQSRTHLFPGDRSPLLGLSTHAPDQAKRAIAAGANYVAIGPVFATGTKPTASPVTLDYVRWAAQNVPIPWFAIGGINLETLPSVLDAGATRICVVSAILKSGNIAQACQQFKERLR